MSMQVLSIFVLFLSAQTVSSTSNGFVDFNFNETFARQLIYLVAASFNKPDSLNSLQNVQSCLSKGFPDYRDRDIVLSKVNYCAGYETDECQNLVVSLPRLRSIFFVYRGTVGASQLLHEITDNSFGAPIDWPYGTNGEKVNKYFYQATQDSYYSAKDYLSNATFAGYKVVFTGHSLGGAIAALTALQAVHTGLVKAENVVLYTYGQPRIGNDRLATLFDVDHIVRYRVIHYHDPVPQIPPFKEYVHFPHEIWYNNSNQKMDPGQYVECSVVDGEDPSCSYSDSVLTMISSFAQHPMYYNHELEPYGLAGCTSGVGQVTASVFFLVIAFLAATFSL